MPVAGAVADMERASWTLQRSDIFAAMECDNQLSLTGRQVVKGRIPKTPTLNFNG